MNDETHSVELTFREWMDICHALGYTESRYREMDMTGQANKFKAIQEEIGDGLKEQ